MLTEHVIFQSLRQLGLLGNKESMSDNRFEEPTHLENIGLSKLYSRLLFGLRKANLVSISPPLSLARYELFNIYISSYEDLISSAGTWPLRYVASCEDNLVVLNFIATYMDVN